MQTLQDKFEGRGSMRGHEFIKLRETPKGYVYQVRHIDSGYTSYEVFRLYRKQKRDTFIGGKPVTFQEGVKYPRDEDFGVWAWACTTLDSALKRLDDFNSIEFEGFKKEAPDKSRGLTNATQPKQR